jgi:phospholipid/cholesterol/gamma-HCH transport system substrate-binding protein
MRKEISNKIRLGIFVIIGIVVLIIGIYFIGEGQQLFRQTFRVTGTFNDVAGLQVGNNVRLSGVNVGVVDLISIVSDTTVRVEVVIDEKARKYIRKDAVMSIGSEGLMGNKMLIITPGTGDEEVIENNDIVQTVRPMNLDDIFVSLKTTIDNTSSIISDLSSIAKSLESGEGTIGKLLMDQTMAQNFDSSITNLKQGSDGFKSLVDDVTDGFAQIDVKDILLSLKTSMDNTSRITGDLSLIISNVQSGEGTIGKLLMDETLQQNIDSTIVNLKEGSDGFNVVIKKAENSWLLWGRKKK